MLKSTPRLPGEAVMKYLDADLEFIQPGEFVRCAATGKKIPLDELRYWSVDHQEAYSEARYANEAIIAFRRNKQD